MEEADPVPPTGAEPVGATSKPTKSLRQTAISRAAKSDADCSNLEELIEAWPELSDGVRGAILVMVRAARQGN